MRLVDRPHFSPFRCAAIPFIGQTHEDTRWIDTGEELDREHVYLSDHAIREAVRVLGWATAEEHEALQHRAAELASRLAEVEDELTEAKGYIESIDVLASAGFTARKKPGRPKKQPEEVA